MRADPQGLELARALLLDAQAVVRSQAIGSRTLHHATRLHWDVLVEVLAGEEALRQALDPLRVRMTKSDSCDRAG
ncbi:MAG: hypothetical protein ACOYEV_05185 [Candidatus Nanopelagicales bacterium]